MAHRSLRSPEGDALPNHTLRLCGGSVATSHFKGAQHQKAEIAVAPAATNTAVQKAHRIQSEHTTNSDVVAWLRLDKKFL